MSPTPPVKAGKKRKPNQRKLTGTSTSSDDEAENYTPSLTTKRQKGVDAESSKGVQATKLNQRSYIPVQGVSNGNQQPTPPDSSEMSETLQVLFYSVSSRH